MEFPSLSIRLLPSGFRLFLVTISCDQALWPQKQLWLARTFDQMNSQRSAYWRPGLPSTRSELWEEAIALAGEVGVARVSGALEMNHGALSRRVDPQKSSSRRRPRRSLAHSEFVEVSRAALPVAKTVSTVIELTSASGNRLTVRLSEPVDVGLLLSQFQARQ